MSFAWGLRPGSMQYFNKSKRHAESWHAVFRFSFQTLNRGLQTTVDPSCFSIGQSVMPACK
jgi:hypothetical protein